MDALCSLLRDWHVAVSFYAGQYKVQLTAYKTGRQYTYIGPDLEDCIARAAAGEPSNG